MVIAISAKDIEAAKIREDLQISYDQDVLRLIEEFQKAGLFVSSVVITQYSGQKSAQKLKRQLHKKNIKVYYHYVIEGYPTDTRHIISKDGFGKNDYIETERQLVVVTAPVPVREKWQHVFPSFTMKTSAASKRATPSLKRSRYGRCR